MKRLQISCPAQRTTDIHFEVDEEVAPSPYQSTENDHFCYDNYIRYRFTCICMVIVPFIGVSCVVPHVNLFDNISLICRL